MSLNAASAGGPPRVARKNRENRPKRPGALALAALGLSSCVPVALPPARVDAGFGPYRADPAPAPRQADPRAPAPVREPPLAEHGMLRASGGLHLASLMASPSFPIDVGMGYALNYFPGPESRLLHGAYGEVSPVVLRSSWWRALVGMRGELILAGARRSDDGYGVFGRASVESFRSVNGSGTGGNEMVGGAGYGMLAAGLYIEAGAQKLPGGDRTTLAVIGVTLRSPAAIGLICCARR